MSRHIGTIEGCDIVEQDDKSVTFTAAARLDEQRLAALERELK